MRRIHEMGERRQEFHIIAMNGNKVVDGLSDLYPNPKGSKSIELGNNQRIIAFPDISPVIYFHSKAVDASFVNPSELKILNPDDDNPLVEMKWRTKRPIQIDLNGRNIQGFDKPVTHLLFLRLAQIIKK